jgi:competence protein ComEC
MNNIKLRVTMIDVGWGDSILIEAPLGDGNSRYGLIDSNDSTYLQSSFIYLKRYFERHDINYKDTSKPVFDFVALTHAHSDHARGLKKIFREFRTKRFWYPKSKNWTALTELLRYANRYTQKVNYHEAVDDQKNPFMLGDVKVSFLWPRRNDIKYDENNNSVVLLLEVGNVSVVLTGDAEEEVWEDIAGEIPDNTLFFKVPHHGSVNGTFGNGDSTPWLDKCPKHAVLGISSHVKPFEHPHDKTVKKFESEGFQYYRTDSNYHITFETNGDADNKVKVSKPFNIKSS